MNLTDEELTRLKTPPAPPAREERMESALRYYATADFLTTEQQQVAENALRR